MVSRTIRIMLCALSFASAGQYMSAAYAQDLNHLSGMFGELNHNPIIKGGAFQKGAILFCDTPSLAELERDKDTAAWIAQDGLLTKSPVTGQEAWSEKIGSNNKGDRYLVVGCWVAGEQATETVNGVQKRYARASYHINDLIRQSPIMSKPVCKVKVSGPVYVLHEDQILYSDQAAKSSSCALGKLLKAMPKVADMESATTLFALKQSPTDANEFISAAESNMQTLQ